MSDIIIKYVSESQTHPTIFFSHLLFINNVFCISVPGPHSKGNVLFQLVAPQCCIDVPCCKLFPTEHKETDLQFSTCSETLFPKGQVVRVTQLTWF